MTNTQDRIDVVLNAPHRHCGEDKKKGEVINVTIEQSNWLINRGIATRQQSKPKQDNKS